MSETRALTALGRAVGTNAPGLGELVRLAGQYADESGPGPVRLGDSKTWVARSARGGVQMWHGRPPTASETRACGGDVVRRAARVQRTTNKAPAKPPSDNARRVGRIFQ